MKVTVNKKNILRRLIQGVFWVFALLVVKRIYVYPMALILEKESPYGFDFSREENYWIMKIFASVEIILMLTFVLAFYLLQSIVKNFINKNYFTQRVSKNFVLAGYLFVVLGGLSFIFKMSLGLFADFGYTVSHIQGSYGNDVFMVFVGLFLVFISKAFFQIEQLKQENDLII